MGNIVQKAEEVNKDDFVKSRTDTILVIPAKAGIQSFRRVIDSVPAPDSAPGFAGVTGFRTFYETVNINLSGC